MTSLTAKPPLKATRSTGLRCAWRQGMHEKDGVGTLWIEFLGEVECELCPVPKTYYRDLMRRPDAVELANNLVRMYQ